MKHLSILLCILVVCASGAVRAADKPVNNPYGAHLLMNGLSQANVDKQLTWVKSLVGARGYVKNLFMGVNKDMPGAPNDWKFFVKRCYDFDLIPVIRLAGTMSNGMWDKPYADGPNDYHSVAAAIKRVVSDLPRTDKYPIYIEVFNETNNHYEWGGKSNPIEYGNFLVQTSNAIRSIGDPRIKVVNGALSPGGSYDNLRFIRMMCLYVPGFINSFDVWASHPYPIGPPEINRHNGSLPYRKKQYGIDGYKAELDVLAVYGRKDLKVMLTETGYSLDADGEDVLADQTLRAFRDYWTQWPEVLAILPFTFNDPFGGFAPGDWVFSDSGTDGRGLPTHAHGNYWAVLKLAKPTDLFGSISGKIVEDRFKTPVAGATVTLVNRGTTKTDGAGNYWFPQQSAGKYKVAVSMPLYRGATSSDIVVADGKNAVGDVALTPLKQGVFEGTIKDAVTGKGLPGVTISTNPGGMTAVTDANGSYIMKNVPPSRYTLTASKSGYYSVVKDRLTIVPGGVVTMNVFTGPGTLPPGVSLIGDRSFEKGDDGPAGGWTIWEKAQQPGALSVDHTVAYTGSSSQKITPKGSARNHVWEATDYNSIRPSKKYRLEVWAKCQDAVGQVKLIGDFFSNEMVKFGSFESTSITGTTGWTKLTAVGTGPRFPDGKSGRLEVRMQADLKSGTAWFDEAAAVEEK